MKTKNIVFCAALVAIVCAGGWSVTAMLAESDETPTGPATTVITQPVKPVVVSPATNFDLEVSSPAELTANHSEEVSVDIPVPDLTWYDPNHLEEVGGIS